MRTHGFRPLLLTLALNGCARDASTRCTEAPCPDGEPDATAPLEQPDLRPKPDLAEASDLAEPEGDMAVKRRWVSKNSGTRSHLQAVSGNGPNNVYAVGDQTYVVLRSIDRGTTWKTCTNPTDPINETVAVDAANAVYTSGSSKVFKSVDDGKTWVEQSTGVGCCDRLVLGPGGSVWGSERNETVIFSTNGGMKWTPLPRDPNANVRVGVRALAVGGGVDNPTVYMAENPNILVSSDLGRSWILQLNHDWYLLAGWAIGSYEAVLTGILYGSSDELLILRSPDGGKSWVRIKVPIKDDTGTGVWGEGRAGASKVDRFRSLGMRVV